MSSSKKSAGGVHVEQEIVHPSARVETPGIDYRPSYAAGYVQSGYVGEPYLLGAFIKALPQWIALQVQAALDARGLNPVVSDAASAQEVFSLVRSILRSDVASAQDALAIHQAVHLLDLALAQDILAVAAVASHEAVAAAADSLAFAFPRMDRADGVDRLVLVAQKALQDQAAARDPFAWRLDRAAIDRSTASDSGVIHKQTYAGGYVENTYVGELTTF